MKSRAQIAFASVLVAVLVLAAAAWAANNDTVLISTDGEVLSVSMSDDGRFAAYIDENGEAVRKDLLTDEIVVLSRHEAGGAPANDIISSPMLSSSGRHAAFGSTDQDLDEDYDDGFPAVSVAQIYVRDVIGAETTLTSRGDGPDGMSVDSFAELGGISDTGRYVAFQTGDDLGTGSGTFSNYFRRDLQANETVLTSVDEDENAVEPAAGELPRISGDGRYLTLNTPAAIDGDDVDGQTDAYRRDVEAGSTEMVSRTAAGTPIAGGTVTTRAISADGSKLLLLTDEPVDGADTNSDTDTYLKDVPSDALTLVSRKNGPGGAVGTGDSFPAGPEALSPDGRFASFGSLANLDPDDTGSDRQVYLRDVIGGTTTLISRPDGSSSAVGNAPSGSSSVAANGGFVAFRSEATNLNPADTDPDTDIYRRELSIAAPGLTGTNPASPADDTTPTVTGTAPAGSEVRIFGVVVSSAAASNAAGLGSGNSTAAADDCHGSVIGTGTASGSGQFSLQVTVANGSTTTLRADATDGLGRTSACSSSSLTYTELAAAADPGDTPDPDPGDDPGDPGDGDPGDPGGPPADTAAPDGTAKKKGKAKAGKTIKIEVSSNEDGEVVARGKQKQTKKGKKRGKRKNRAAATATVEIAKKKGKCKKRCKRKRKKKLTVRLKPARKSINADQSKTLKLKPKGKKNKRKARKLKRKVRKKGAKAKAKITVKFTDEAGNTSKEKLRFKLR